uniref:Ig-like domain-containing protein n=1 Tax=Castor canadensis TaxID=51338 RepID=A0A8C0VXG0_CASCN
EGDKVTPDRHLCLMGFSFSGSCVGQTDKRGDGKCLFPNSSFFFSVVPPGSNVTLKCRSPIPSLSIVLKKKGIVLQSMLLNMAEMTTEFYLIEIQHSDSGPYTCEYSNKSSPDATSQPSDDLLLLVTGDLPKPSHQTHQLGSLNAGGKVTLQCRKPNNMTKYKTFALLKEGASSPILLQSSEKDSVEFTLENVTVSESGKYSCVYHQAMPLWSSHPSDHLEILVKGNGFHECCNNSEALTEAWYSMLGVPPWIQLIHSSSLRLREKTSFCPKQSSLCLSSQCAATYQQIMLQKLCFMKTNESAVSAARKTTEAVSCLI